MTQVVIEICIIVLLLLANGVLAMAEMSLVSSRKARLKALADGGSKSATTALHLSETPNQFLSTVQIGITLIGILAGTFGGATLSHLLSQQLVAAGMPATYANTLSLAVVVLGITYLSLIIGELVPKRLALSSPERFACLLAPAMKTLSKFARPGVRLLGWSSDIVLRVLGAKSEPTAKVTDEEVHMLMQEGHATGVFHKAESQMVERVLALDDLSVQEIMTPRPKVVFVHRDDPHEQAWHKLAASRHSYFPVYQNNRDHVVGVVSVKSIYATVAAGSPVKISDLMTEPLFVPATQSAARLLETFRQSRKHLAIVADEFGSVVGVVTLVDVLEAIVGEVPSQEERSQPDVRIREDGTWLVDGTAHIETVEEKIPGLRFRPSDERDYQTMAGFMLEELGHIPKEGEKLTSLGWEFEIIDIDPPRIDKVLLRQQNTAPDMAPK